MADPDDNTLLIHKERARNAGLARGLHPGFGHLALFASLFVVEGDAIGHLVGHFLDEWRYQLLVVFPTVLADDDKALVLEFGVSLVQVRNRRAARATPGGPELDDVRRALFEFFNRLALHPFAGLEFGGVVADFESRFGGCRH